MLQLGNQFGQLVAQPSMCRIVIVRRMPQQRYRDLIQVDRGRAKAQPEFSGKPLRQARPYRDDDGACDTSDGTVRKRCVVSATERRKPRFSSASSTKPRALRPCAMLVST